MGSGLPHSPGLDGIRALAIASVLAFHAGLPLAGGGFLGVSTFFTLSGYLICSLLLVEFEAEGRLALGRFWARRFRRLMPAALMALLGIALFGATVAGPVQRWRLAGDAYSALFYVSNWRFLLAERSYVDPLSGLGGDLAARHRELSSRRRRRSDRDVGSAGPTRFAAAAPCPRRCVVRRVAGARIR